MKYYHRNQIFLKKYHHLYITNMGIITYIILVSGHLYLYKKYLDMNLYCKFYIN